MPTTGGNLGLKRAWAQGENGWASAMDLNLLLLDALAMPTMKGVLINTPPGSPAQGDAYVIGTSPTGAWVGKGTQIGIWDGAAWQYTGAPKLGWWVYNAADGKDYSWNGSAWSVFAVADSLLAHLAGTETFSGLKTFSAGINLGQQDLTNYSQGTWTPTLAGGTTPGSPTYTTQSGRYRRVGDLCFVNFDVKLSSVGGMAGSVRVGGLPFTPADTLSCGAIGYMELVTYGAGSYPFLTSSAGNPYLNLFTTASGGTGGQLQASALAATSRIIGSIAFTL